MDYELNLEKAVKILKDSNRVLFLTGAGMSADSGIPTFQDKEGISTYFSKYHPSELDPKKFANIKLFKQNPELAWGFYEIRRRMINSKKPHKGYNSLNLLLNSVDESFIATTNIDGYHLRSGVPSNKIAETHGSIWRLQYLDGSDSYVEENNQVPLCDLDEETSLVPTNSLPSKNNRLLRPNVFMHGGDSKYIGNKYQRHNFMDFLERKIDSVFLIGSGKIVPKNLNLARFFQKQGANVVCINPILEEYQGILVPDVHIASGAERSLTDICNLVNH